MSPRSLLQRYAPIRVRCRARTLNITLRVHGVASVTLTAAMTSDAQLAVGGHLWRLYVDVWLGGFWQDEDGECRALAGVNVRAQTYGLAEKVCEIVGHKPEPSVLGWVSCKRCQTTLERPS